MVPRAQLDTLLEWLIEAKAELDAEAKAGLDPETGLVPREQLDTGEQD